MPLMAGSALLRPSPKRDHLVETAWTLFYRHGFRAVGIDTILEEAGVAKMTLYKHFASKEALILAVLERRHHEFVASLQTAMAEAAGSSSDRLLAAFDWLKAWLESPQFNGCAFIRAVVEFPSRDDRPHQVAAAHKKAIADLLVQQCRHAGLRHPAEVGKRLALLLEGAIITAHTHGPRGVAQNAKEAARQLVAAAATAS